MSLFVTHNQPILLVKREITYRSHFHYEAEVIYVVRGSYRVISRGVTYDLNAGDIWLGFPFEEHSYVNIGDNLTMLGIFSPEDVGAVGNLLREHETKNPVVNVSRLSPGFGENLVRLAQLWMAKVRRENNTRQCDLEQVLDESYIPFEVSKDTILLYLSAAISELIGAMELCTPEKVGVDMIESIINYCRDNMSDPELSMTQLSKAIGLSRSQISRRMSQTMKTTFPQFMHALRICRARQLLKHTNDPITQIIYDCGFSSHCSFNRAFHDIVKMSPSEYRKRSREESDNVL